MSHQLIIYARQNISNNIMKQQKTAQFEAKQGLYILELLRPVRHEISNQFSYMQWICQCIMQDLSRVNAREALDK